MTLSPVLDRRAFVAASMIALGGCATCRFPTAGSVPHNLGDAHAHFFNLADLPAHNVMKYAIVPNYLPQLPRIARAMAGIATRIAQNLAITARAEMQQLDQGRFTDENQPSPQDFGREIKQLQEEVITQALESGGFSGLDPANSDAASHLELAEMLGAIPAATAQGIKSGVSDIGRVTIDERVYARIARNQPDPGSAQRATSTPSREEIKATLRWAYVMILSRRCHVSQYLKAIRTNEARIGHAINLLVDYDHWMGQGPRANSGHGDQVAFWTRYAAVAKQQRSPLQLHTFAGYDPLKHAAERVKNSPATHFSTMLGWLDGNQPSHRILGFKLYPPMGFKPSSNRDFSVVGVERAGKEVYDGWPGDKTRIGEEIDAALEIFFRECAKRDVPMLAHAADSMEAMPNAGRKASPRHWLERARMVRAYGLRPAPFPHTPDSHLD